MLGFLLDVRSHAFSLAQFHSETEQAHMPIVRYKSATYRTAAASDVLGVATWTDAYSGYCVGSRMGSSVSPPAEDILSGYKLFVVLIFTLATLDHV